MSKNKAKDAEYGIVLHKELQKIAQKEAIEIALILSISSDSKRHHVLVDRKTRELLEKGESLYEIKKTKGKAEV